MANKKFSELTQTESTTIQLRKKANNIQVEAKGASHTLVSTDEYKMIQMQAATATTVTVPNNTSVAFDIGTVIAVDNIGAGQVTVTGASGVSLVGPVLTLAQYETAVLHKTAVNTWRFIKGAGSSSSAGGTLSAPTLGATSGTATPVVLDWDDIANATRYSVQRATDSAFTTDLLTLATVTGASTYTDSAAAAGTTYYYRVKAEADGYTASAYSNTTTVTTAASGGTWTDIAAWDNANLVNATNVWTVGAGGSSSYGNLAKSASYLASGADGAIRMKKTATDAIDAVIGFNTSNATIGIASMPYAAWMANDGKLYAREGGSPIDCGTIAVGEYPVIRRTGSAITLHISDGTTEGTAVHTYAASTAALYVVSDFNKETGKMYDPEGEGLS